jgi:hypothetical protein
MRAQAREVFGRHADANLRHPMRPALGANRADPEGHHYNGYIVLTLSTRKART